MVQVLTSKSIELGLNGVLRPELILGFKFIGHKTKLTCAVDVCKAVGMHFITGFDEDWMELTSDVQKKVIPWRLMLPEQELETGLQEEYMKKRQKTGGLVLVASLIDKIPNLGGKY